ELWSCHPCASCRQQEQVRRVALLRMWLLHCASVGARSPSCMFGTMQLEVASTPVLPPFVPPQSMPAATNPTCSSASRNIVARWHACHPLLKALNSALLHGKDMTWPRFWYHLRGGARTAPAVHGLCAPR